MKKDKGRPIGVSSAAVSPAVAGAIRHFSQERRNRIRGAIASARQGKLLDDDLEGIRNNSVETDMVAAAFVLESPTGLRKRAVTNLLQRDIELAHNLKARDACLEAAYASGFLVSRKDDTIRAIATIALLSQLTEVSIDDALSALQRTAETWGASNYLALKIAYIKEFFDLNAANQAQLDNIDRIIGHDRSPLIQYLALENLMPKLSIFSVAQRHTNIHRENIDLDFRRYHSLNNLAATPFSDEDCAGFLLRGVETSLIDTVRCLWIIVNLRDRLPKVYSAITRNLDHEILEYLMLYQDEVAGMTAPDLILPCEAISEIKDASEPLGHEDRYRSLDLYRRSIAFLEFPHFCKYRNDLDRVISYRLVASLLGDNLPWYGDDFVDLGILLQNDGIFCLSQHNTTNVKVDTFYRTYLFLRFIQNVTNLSQLTSSDIQTIFDNTTSLDNLLLERELKTLHLNASDEARATISVLALALYRRKSSDPDIDFDFREQLEDYIIKNFDGKIADFIENLAPTSPDIAHYIASSLDEATLQKMYKIVDSPTAAENARRDILMSVGIHLKRIEYIIEAESIETRAKVAKLKNYFDTSRMYVDSVAMKKWLSSNPSAYTEQFKELLPTFTAKVTATRNITTNSGKEAKIEIVALTSTDEYLVERMATEAFREFCSNNEFGIESYLGRRIRHNTLNGVMTKGVDAVLQRYENQAIIAGTPFGTALISWSRGYKIFIERMRREFLQFRSDGKPNALFSTEIDTRDTATISNLQQLMQNLRRSGPEMLDELIVSFCWRQIAPQLENASRQIRVKMNQDVSQQLDQALQKFNGPEEIKVKFALENSLSSVFAQVASWFQVPQTGFVPASIPDICNIIDIENNRMATPTVVRGENLHLKYYGISVHRLYDCLAVLVQNAFKHGKPSTDVIVEMTSIPIERTNLNLLDIAVISTLPSANSQECIARVAASLTSTETGRDMVTEGYSGIKKVKFITRLNEGVSTVTHAENGDMIALKFRLKVEVAEQEVGH